MRLKVNFTLVNSSSSSNNNHPRAVSTNVARSNQNVGTVQVSRTKKYATVPLKVCMALICYSRPDLIPTEATDYAISSLDPNASSSSSESNNRIFEGKGMMSWVLEERASGQSRVMGRIIEEESFASEEDSDNHQDAKADERVLEIVLELIPRAPIPRKDFITNLSYHQSTSPIPPAANSPQHTYSAVPGNANIQGILQALATSASQPSNDIALGFLHSLLGAALGSQQFQINPQPQTFTQAQGDVFTPHQQAGSHTGIGHDGNNLAKATDSHDYATSTAANPNERTRKTQHRRSVTSSSVASAFNADPLKVSNPTRLKDAQARPIHSDEVQSLGKANANTSNLKLKYWGPGCIKCSKQESVSWRVRKKRKRPLDDDHLNGGPSSIGFEEGHEREEEGTKKLCEECAQELPSIKKKKELLHQGLPTSRLPGSSNLSDSIGGHRTHLTESRGPSPRPVHVQTSPLRRSPRRHPASFTTKAGTTSPTTQFRDHLCTSPIPKARQEPLLSSDLVTSHARRAAAQAAPSNSQHPSESEGNIVHKIKKRKFTTALSAAALVEEENLRKQKLEDQKEKAKRVFSDSRAASGSSDAIKGYTRVDYQQSCYPADAEPHAASDGATKAKKGCNVTDFLMNASPGTAIRSVLDEVLPLNLDVGGTLPHLPPRSPLSRENLNSFLAMNEPSALQETPGKVFHNYVDSLSTPNLGTYLVFDNLQGEDVGALESFMATPFRSTPRQFTRSRSEQPPSSLSPESARFNHMYQETEISRASLPIGYTSADTDTVKINLLPPTADRGRSTSLADSLDLATTVAQKEDQYKMSDPMSDSILDDFQSFLLKTGSSLFSPSPPRIRSTNVRKSPSQANRLSYFKQSNNPGNGNSLAPVLHHASTKRINANKSSIPQQYLSNQNTSIVPSSDFDIDIRNMPPSSPPPLPLPPHQYLHGLNDQNVQSLERFIENFDGQSPISVTTTVTAEGTPQETFSHSFSGNVFGSLSMQPRQPFSLPSTLSGDENTQNDSQSRDVADWHDRTSAQGDTCQQDFLPQSPDIAQKEERSGSTDLSDGALKHIFSQGVDKSFGTADMESDPLLEFFSKDGNGGDNLAISSSGAAKKQHYSHKPSEASSISLTWSDSTSSSASSTLASTTASTGCKTFSQKPNTETIKLKDNVIHRLFH